MVHPPEEIQGISDVRLRLDVYLLEPAGGQFHRPMLDPCMEISQPLHEVCLSGKGRMTSIEQSHEIAQGAALRVFLQAGVQGERDTTVRAVDSRHTILEGAHSPEES